MLESGVGGRIYERTADGVEHDWGVVTVWDPPKRLAYLWHLGRDRSEATDVDIRFVARGPAIPGSRSSTGAGNASAPTRGRLAGPQPDRVGNPAAALRGGNHHEEIADGCWHQRRSVAAEDPTGHIRSTRCTKTRRPARPRWCARSAPRPSSTTCGRSRTCTRGFAEQDGWVPLGAADEKKPAAEGTVEAWGRSPDNPVGGWYGLRNGYRGRFGMYLPPLLEELGLAELTHDARNNQIRSIR